MEADVDQVILATIKDLSKSIHLALDGLELLDARVKRLEALNPPLKMPMDFDVVDKTDAIFSAGTCRNCRKEGIGGTCRGCLHFFCPDHLAEHYCLDLKGLEQ